MLVPLDVEWLTNPKIVAAGKDGRALWLAALLYGHKHATGGFIPESMLPLLCGAADVDLGASERTVERLTSPWMPGKCPLWDEMEGGWMIHDFDQFAPTRATRKKPAPAKAVDPDSDAYRLSCYLAKRIAAHIGRDVKTPGWDKQMDLLLRRGPADWASPAEIPPSEVKEMIDTIFDETGEGPARANNGGFAWANVILSAGKLRKQWVKLCNWRDQLPKARPQRPQLREYGTVEECPTCHGSTFIPDGRGVKPCPDCR